MVFGPPTCPAGTIVVDFAATLGQLMASRSCKDQAAWSPEWRGDLASAVSGGQWPQTRRAAVPAWGIENKNCQLCHQEPGTLEHRWHCKATRPAEGWPREPEHAKLALARISQERRKLLQTRAMLTVRVPKPPAHHRSEWFTWHLEPPDDINDAIWYLDGSMLNGEWADFRAVGFAIVVVSRSRELLAYGSGGPPHWCNTAAAAEAWALFTSVS